MSLRVERNERTITVISDDKNAENALLGEALSAAAPQLLPAFDEAPFENGELRLDVGYEDWGSLLEALEAMDSDNPGVTGECVDQVDGWQRELDAA